MKLFIRPYRPEDLEGLKLQNVQGHEIAAIADPLSLLSGGEAWTMVAGIRGQRETQQVRACGGLLFYTPHRARAWTLMGRDLSRREWGFAARAMGARLTELQEFKCLRRVEAETPLDFAGGHKLLLHLGFRFECAQPAAGPNGETFALFARLRDRPLLPNRYEKLRALAYSTVIEDVLERRHQRNAA